MEPQVPFPAARRSALYVRQARWGRPLGDRVRVTMPTRFESGSWSLPASRASAAKRTRHRRRWPMTGRLPRGNRRRPTRGTQTENGGPMGRQSRARRFDSGGGHMSTNHAQTDDVVEMYQSGMEWSEIADALGTDVDEAMARYRQEAYDHWDTGWELDVEEGTGRVETGAVDLWTDGDASIEIEELRDAIPMTVIVNDGETRTLALAGLSAEQARELAATLDECADILEGR